MPISTSSYQPKESSQMHKAYTTAFFDPMATVFFARLLNQDVCFGYGTMILEGERGEEGKGGGCD